MSEKDIQEIKEVINKYLLLIWIILNKLNKNLVIKYLREFRINNFKNK